MKAVLAANGRRGLACLRALLASAHEVASVVLHASGSDAVEDAARAAGIEVLRPASINDPATVAEISAVGADILILAGYTQILRQPILEAAAPVVINLHGGKLPEYRGGSPINWQIINGETEGGCTIMYVDAGIDTADVIRQETYSIGPDDTAEDAVRRTLEIFPPLLIRCLDEIEQGVAPRIQQDAARAGYFRKRRPEDGRIPWSDLTAIGVHNLVRALAGPELPGAFCFLGDRKLVVRRTVRLDQPHHAGPPGRVVAHADNGAIVMATDGSILLTAVRFEGDDSDRSAAEVLGVGDDLS